MFKNLLAPKMIDDTAEHREAEKRVHYTVKDIGGKAELDSWRAMRAELDAKIKAEYTAKYEQRKEVAVNQILGNLVEQDQALTSWQNVPISSEQNLKVNEHKIEMHKAAQVLKRQESEAKKAVDEQLKKLDISNKLAKSLKDFFSTVFEK